MGASESKNVADEIAQIVNEVTNGISVSSSVTNFCSQSFKAKKCTFEGAVSVDTICANSATGNQISQMSTSVNLKNLVAQKLAQLAASKVGSLGVGFAQATNMANAISSQTNVVTNTMVEVARAFSMITQNFDCDHCTFFGPVSWNATGTSTSVQEQFSSMNAISDISNSVTQDISQKATATVEGIGGVLIFLIILILAIAYIFFKPLETVLSNKYIMFGGVSAMGLIVFTLMFMFQTPPFFDEDQFCDCRTGEDFVDCKIQTVDIQSPPLRYSYPIVGNEHPDQYEPGLLQIVISICGGWGVAPDGQYIDSAPTGNDTNANFQRRIQADSYWTTWANNVTAELSTAKVVTKINPPPSGDGGDPLWVTDTSWLGQYFKDATGLNSPAGLRYLLCRLCRWDDGTRIPTNVAIDGEPVDNEWNNNTYTYVPATAPSVGLAASGPGQVSGMFGILNNRSHKFKTLMSKVGNYVLIGLVMVFLFLTFQRREKANQSD